MSKQTENETMAPQEFREFLLAELEASRQAIAELSNEQLEEVVGGRGRRVGNHIEVPTSLEASIDLSGPTVTPPSTPGTSYHSAVSSSPSTSGSSYHSFSPSGSSDSSSSHVEYLPDVNTNAARVARVNQWLLPVLKRSHSAGF
jgi:hypothetical protein